MKINMEAYLNHDINNQAPPIGGGFGYKRDTRIGG